MKQLTHLLFLGLLALFVSTHTSNAQPTDSNSVLRLGLDELAIELNPAQQLTRRSGSIQANIFETLVRRENTGEFVPALAAEWMISDDGTAYQFRIRNDAAWSDNVAMTAHSIAQSLNTQIQELGLAPPLEGEAPRFTAQDDEWLRLDLPEPNFNILHALTISNAAPRPMHVASPSDYEHPWGITPPPHMVYSGPYVIEAGQDSTLRLRPNAAYYDAASLANQGVDIPKMIQSRADFVGAFLAGQYDLLALDRGIPPAFVAHLDPQLIEPVPTNEINKVLLNVTAPPLDNRSVRRALAMVIDFQELTETANAEGLVVHSSFVLDGFSQNFDIPEPDWIEMSRDVRLAEAKALLAEAGYNENNPLEFTVLSVPGANPGRESDIATLMRVQWAQINVNVTVEASEFHAWFPLVEAGDYQAAMMSWFFGGRMTPFYLYEIFTSESQFNLSNFRNEDYDLIIKQSHRTQEIATLNQLSRQAHNILMHELPAFPTFTKVNHLLKQPGLRTAAGDRTYELRYLKDVGYIDMADATE